MKRREAIAGLGSLGVLAGGGVALWRARTSSPPAADDGESDDRDDGPVAIETIDAPGSEAGKILVPNDGLTVATFFFRGCGSCQALLPEFGEAREELRAAYGDRLTTLWVTNYGPSEDELRSFWDDHGGDWSVGYDPDSALATAYGVVGYPWTVAIDASGSDRWRGHGTLSDRELVGSITDAVDPAEFEDGSEAESGDESAEGSAG